MPATVVGRGRLVSISSMLVSAAIGCGGPQVDTTMPPPPALVERPAEEPPAARDADEHTRGLLRQIAVAEPAAGIRLQHELLALGRESLPTLVAVMVDRGAPSVERQAAASALGEADDPAACNALSLAWLDRHGNAERVLVAIAIAAGRCGVFEPLRAIVEGASEVDVRLKAAMSLALMGDADSGLQIAALRTELEPGLAEFADLAMALLGDVATAESLAARVGDARLAPAISDFFDLAWWRCGLGDVAPLRDTALEHPDPVVRQAALAALVESSDPWALTQLTTALSDPSPRVAHAAAAWIEQGGR